MRKEINSKSKRKWVAGGLAAFASVALLTTGFATWVVINSSTTKEDNIGVTVDTAKNMSVRMTLTLGSSAGIKLQESAKVDGNQHLLGTDGIDGTVANPLRVEVAEFFRTNGADYEWDYKHINFTISVPKDKETEYASNIVDADGEIIKDTNSKRTKPAGGYTYIDAPAAINVSALSFEPVEGTNNVKATVNQSVLDFTWGSFFGEGNQSPLSFYNGAFDDKKGTVEGDKIADQAVQELNAMHKHFLKGADDSSGFKQIHLTATLTKE